MLLLLLICSSNDSFKQATKQEPRLAVFSRDGFLWCDNVLMSSIPLFAQCTGSTLLSGYVFENATTITPYLEEPRLGPTSQFCSEIAKRLGCYVLAGYPERLSDEEDKPPLEALETTHSTSGVAVGANSAVLYDPLGSWAGGYRKTNLYDTDKTWAKSGMCLLNCLSGVGLISPQARALPRTDSLLHCEP